MRQHRVVFVALLTTGIVLTALGFMGVAALLYDALPTPVEVGFIIIGVVGLGIIVVAIIGLRNTQSDNFDGR